MSDNQQARRIASSKEGAKGRKGSSKKEGKEVKEVKEEKEKKKLLTGSASRPLGVRGSGRIEKHLERGGGLNKCSFKNLTDKNKLHSYFYPGSLLTKLLQSTPAEMIYLNRGFNPLIARITMVFHLVSN